MAASSAFVLVEGVSDQVALETLARCLGRDLRAEGVSIVTMGGATLIGGFLAELVGGHRSGIRVAGLCDEAEAGIFRSALEGAGLGRGLTRADMEMLGFYVCVEDLEDELIRALGVDAVLAVVGDQGESAGFRTFPA